jgi:hypothetical protein
MNAIITQEGWWRCKVCSHPNTAFESSCVVCEVYKWWSEQYV